MWFKVQALLLLCLTWIISYENHKKCDRWGNTAQNLNFYWKNTKYLLKDSCNIWAAIHQYQLLPPRTMWRQDHQNKPYLKLTALQKIEKCKMIEQIVRCQFILLIVSFRFVSSHIGLNSLCITSEILICIIRQAAFAGY